MGGVLGHRVGHSFVDGGLGLPGTDEMAGHQKNAGGYDDAGDHHPRPKGGAELEGGQGAVELERHDEGRDGEGQPDDGLDTALPRCGASYPLPVRHETLHTVPGRGKKPPRKRAARLPGGQASGPLVTSRRTWATGRGGLFAPIP